MLAAEVIGKSPVELARARDDLAAYLGGTADTPGAWRGLDVFDLARPHKARHGSILLAFQAAADAAAAATGIAAAAASDTAAEQAEALAPA